MPRSGWLAMIVNRRQFVAAATLASAGCNRDETLTEARATDVYRRLRQDVTLASKRAQDAERPFYVVCVEHHADKMCLLYELMFLDIAHDLGVRSYCPEWDTEGLSTARRILEQVGPEAMDKGAGNNETRLFVEAVRRGMEVLPMDEKGPTRGLIVAGLGVSSDPQAYMQARDGYERRRNELMTDHILRRRRALVTTGDFHAGGLIPALRSKAEVYAVNLATAPVDTARESDLGRQRHQWVLQTSNLSQIPQQPLPPDVDDVRAFALRAIARAKASP